MTLCSFSDEEIDTRNISMLPNTALTITPDSSNVWMGAAPPASRANA